MQQDVAQFLANVGLIVLHQGVTQFESLFDRVGAQALVSLLAVPRTLLAQGVEHVQKAAKGRQLFFAGMHGFFLFKFQAKIAFFYGFIVMNILFYKKNIIFVLICQNIERCPRSVLFMESLSICTFNISLSTCEQFCKKKAFFIFPYFDFIFMNVYGNTDIKYSG